MKLNARHQQKVSFFIKEYLRLQSAMRISSSEHVRKISKRILMESF